MTASALQTLAEEMGILPSWHDVSGQLWHPTADTQRALLGAMGVEAATEAEAADSLQAQRAEAARRKMPQELVVAPGRSVQIPLSGPVDWRLECEDGELWEGRALEWLEIAPPAGLHRLFVGDEHCLIIAAPERAASVAEVLGRERAWGVTAALYGLRSTRNLGVGDYRDLAVAAAALGELGADFIGINPVHARGATSAGISPYTPSCRTAFEPDHIAVDLVPGFEDCAEARRILSDNAARLASARAADLADYDTHRAVGHEVLRALFADFSQANDMAADAFAEWRRSRGLALEGFALFEALSLREGADWRRWPEPLRACDGPAVRAFAESQIWEIRFHAWLQWLAERQIAAAQADAMAAGMGLGLYLDVAVGAQPGGADTWSSPSCFAQGVTLGAPPDAFSPDGQDWSLAPFSPSGLRAAGYRPFIEMLRTAMSHAGIVRIDHIIGFQRSFWVPEDGVPGCYVSYPLESLLALIRLEAQRAGCIVVGEDLGVVPAGLRERLSEAGLLGCTVMQFEQQDQAFKSPAAYRPASLASFGTHDTPTLRGWWSGWDIDKRHEIDRAGTASREEDQLWRAEQRRALAGLLREEGLLPADVDAAEPPAELNDATAEGLHRLLARSRAELVAVQLEDIFGFVEQQNLPGTVDEYPNWRRRYPVGVELLSDDPDLRAVASIFEPVTNRSPANQEMQPCP